MNQSTPPRRTRIVVCRGEYCNLSRRADQLLAQLQPHLVGQPCFKLETANCLSMCAVGPNLVIYPAGLVFNGMNESRMAQFIRDHIQPCEPTD